MGISLNSVGKNAEISRLPTSTSSGFQFGKTTPALLQIWRDPDQAGISSWKIYHFKSMGKSELQSIPLLGRDGGSAGDTHDCTPAPTFTQLLQTLHAN